MVIDNVSYPLKLSPDNLLEQIETIGLAFNRFNPIMIRRSRGCRCCSIALNKTRIVSIGVNKNKTTPKYAAYARQNKMNIHAEIDMIMNVERTYELEKVSDIYVVRGYSKLLPSFPCELCLEYIVKKFKPKCTLHYYLECWQSISIKDLN